MDVRERLIFLHACPKVTWNILFKFIKKDPTLKKIVHMNSSELGELLLLNKAQAEVLYRNIHSLNIRSLMNTYNSKEIKIVTILDDAYPQLLKHIYDPPWVLYCKGNLSFFAEPNKLSVVGTRDPSEYGIQSLKHILEPIIFQGWVIVSGLAVGIDALAHQLSINNQGKTIAVLGSGFDYIYPRCHQLLANKIATDHLLLSEFPPTVKPQKWYFPMRNRIISGLTKGTLIIEARKKSGSLITADLALQQGKDVFSVPGSILDERSAGTNWLIQQGAKLTKCSDDVLNEI